MAVQSLLCRHCSLLVLRNVNMLASIMYSREVVTQGDPLDMVTYSLVVILLIIKMKAAHPDVIQPRYYYARGALPTFINIEDYFKSLKHMGPNHG